MHTQLLGILNITPDSFSDGGCYNTVESALSQARKLMAEGAAFVDIGAESTRPGAIALSPSEEWSRLEAPLTALKQAGIPVSVDSYHPENVKKALNLGADMINDVSGCETDSMQEVIAAGNKPVIIMHNLGVPASKHRVLAEGCDPVEIVVEWAEKRLQQLEARGIRRERAILDPGIGFGKNAYQSIALLRALPALQSVGIKLCIGHSRKSFLSSFSPIPAKDRDIETIAVSLKLYPQGVDYLRVHDIAGHQRAFTIFSQL